MAKSCFALNRFSFFLADEMKLKIVTNLCNFPWNQEKKSGKAHNSTFSTVHQIKTHRNWTQFVLLHRITEYEDRVRRGKRKKNTHNSIKFRNWFEVCVNRIQVCSQVIDCLCILCFFFLSFDRSASVAID